MEKNDNLLLDKQITTMYNHYTCLQLAFLQSAMPCNPLPFLNELMELIRKEGTGFINTDKAKMLLLTVNIIAYGQLSTIDTVNEWSRLKQVAETTK